MKLKELLALAALAAAVAASSAHASAPLTFDFSFSDDMTHDVVSGTISGLMEGNDTLGDVTVDVLTADDSGALGEGWTPNTTGYNNGATYFTVAGGEISYASGVYVKAVAGGTDYLFFGSNPGVTYRPQLGGPYVYETSYSTPEKFTEVSVSAAPEPGTWALMLGGIGVVGGMLRVAHLRRREKHFAAVATA
jgi:hypothetical protein